MKVKDLIRLIEPYPNYPVKVSTSLLDENGTDVVDIILQEYDDGNPEYEIVIMGDYEV